MCQFCQSHVFYNFFEGLAYFSIPPNLFSHVASYFLFFAIVVFLQIVCESAYSCITKFGCVRARNWDVSILLKLHFTWFFLKGWDFRTSPPTPLPKFFHMLLHATHLLFLLYIGIVNPHYLVELNFVCVSLKRIWHVLIITKLYFMHLKGLAFWTPPAPFFVICCSLFPSFSNV